jgi:hypothetical protein
MALLEVAASGHFPGGAVRGSGPFSGPGPTTSRAILLVYFSSCGPGR